MDRDSKSPYDLLEDIENVLGINTCPINWPIGSGKEFKGVYERNTKKVIAFTANNGQKEVEKEEFTLDDPELDSHLAYGQKETFCRECIVIKGDGFDLHTRNLMFKSNKLF